MTVRERGRFESGANFPGKTVLLEHLKKRLQQPEAEDIHHRGDTRRTGEQERGEGPRLGNPKN